MCFRTHSPTNIFYKHTGQLCCSTINHFLVLCFLYFNALSWSLLLAKRDGLFLHLANKNASTLKFNKLNSCHKLETFSSSPASPSKFFNWPLSKCLNFFKSNTVKKLNQRGFHSLFIPTSYYIWKYPGANFLTGSPIVISVP